MQRALFILFILLAPFGALAATEVVKTIRSDGTGDYTSLSAWESAEQRDLVAANQIAVARIEGPWTTPDGRVIIDGWTTDAEHYIRIYVAPDARHAGIWSDAKYRIEDSYNVVHVREPFTRIEGLQIRAGSVNDFGQKGIVADGGGESGIRISGCIIRLGSSVIDARYCAGIQVGSEGVDRGYIYNNMIFNFKRAANYEVYGIQVIQVQNKVMVCNNTIYNCDVGIAGHWSNPIIAKNNLVQWCNVNYKDVGSSGSNNFSSLNDAPGTESINNGWVAFVSLDPAGYDLHLAASDTFAKDRGKDLSADPDFAFNQDIDGQVRTGAWDIGADEYSSGTPGDNVPPLLSISAPASGTNWTFGSSHDILWSATDNVGVTSCSLAYSPDGTTWTQIATVSGAGGRYSWLVPFTPSTSARIRVAATDAGGNSSSILSAAFTISAGADTIKPTVTVLLPNGNENWPAGSVQKISWRAEDNVRVTACSLYYTTDNLKYTLIAVTTGSQYVWTLPSTPSQTCKVRIAARDSAGNVNHDVSDQVFHIASKPAVTSPDSIAIDPGAKIDYVFQYDAGGQPGTPEFIVLKSPISNLVCFGSKLLGGPVASTPVPRVDTVIVRFSLNSFFEEFMLRVFVKDPTQLGVRIAPPSAFSLNAAFARNEARFDLGFDQAGPYVVRVYNISGRLVWSHSGTALQPGTVSVMWKPELSNSIYTVELRSHGRCLRRSLAYVK